MGHRPNFSNDFKVEVVGLANKLNNNSYSAKKYGVSEATVRNWRN